MLALALAACSAADDRVSVSAYPSLRSVPEAPRPSYPIEERRRIVRELVEDRDESLRRSALVRSRSGLAVAAPPPAAPVDADRIIPDAPESDEAFRLGSKEGAPADSVYRDEPQFEDGGLDDFIRRLKRDTQPPSAVEEESDLDPLPVDDETDELGWIDPQRSTAAIDAPMLMAAVAPPLIRRPATPADVMIRLAAGEGEQGFFCDWFGWTVAWSDVCPPEGQASARVGRDPGAALQEGGDEQADAAEDEDQRGREERRLSKEEATEAVENDGGEGVVAPAVTSSLEKLRDFIRARRASSGEPAPDRRRALREAEEPALTPSVEPPPDSPPLPERRPERIEDLTIVDRGEVFDFVRTPTPAFKPTPPGPTAVILPPANAEPARPAATAPPPRPALRPASPPDRREEERLAPAVPSAGGAPAAERKVAALDAAKAAPRAEPKAPSSAARAAIAADLAAAKEPKAGGGVSDPGALDEYVIEFAPNAHAPPEGVEPRLVAMLEAAKASDAKLYIIGEAATNHLARRRATDVGALLVRLGATVEVLEYDHQTRLGVDQVRLVLRSADADPALLATEPSVVVK